MWSNIRFLLYNLINIKINNIIITKGVRFSSDEMKLLFDFKLKLGDL